jgi:kanamycin nucleotidyltransferase
MHIQSPTLNEAACCSLEDLFAGPRHWSRAERLALAGAIIQQLKTAYGSDLRAVALYGSVARTADGPFSDLEMWVALADAVNGETTDKDYQWVHGPGIVELNVMNVSALRAYAAVVEADWPVTHGQFVNARALWEAPESAGLVEELRRIAVEPAPDAVQRALSEAIVGNLYELVGKLRNASDETSLAFLAMQAASEVVCINGLAAGRCFASGATRLREAAALSQFDGAKELLQLVAAGELSDRAVVTDAVGRVWAGIRPWASARGLEPYLLARCRP